MEIKEALEEIQKLEGFGTQRELAKSLGISPPQLSNYIHGKSLPSLNMAGKLYARYGFQIEPFTEKALQKEADYIEVVDKTGSLFE